jgi:hypothetical protein
MKKILLSILLIVPCLLFSQRKTVEKVEYNRSSLHVMMMEDNSMPKKDIIVKTFNEMDFPDKYDNHLLDVRSYDFISVKIDGSENSKIIVGSGKLNDIEKKIDTYFTDNQIANQMIAKWVNRQPDGTMDPSLIGERGLKDAKVDEIEVAATLQKGSAVLAKAGKELISNTFLVVNHFSFVDNELVAKPLAEATYAAAKIAIEKGDMPEMGKKIALKAAEAVLNKALEKAKGYSVWTRAFLYQLDWNDSILDVFSNRYWIGKNTSPEEREKRNNLFKATDFKMKFIGNRELLY